MYHYTAYGLHIQSEIELQECLPATGEKPDVIFRLASFQSPNYQKTRINRRNILARSAMPNLEELYLSWEGVANYKAIGGNELLIEAHTTDPGLLSLFTLSEALGLILFQRGYYLLHASSVQVGDEAWCFMGVPGAGKSTTAAAFVKAGCPLLSDDLTTIKLDASGQAYILPGFPQLKVWENTARGLSYDPAEMERVSEGVNKFSMNPRSTFPREPQRLGAVYFLHAARNKKSLEPFPAIKVPFETAKHFPLSHHFLTSEVLQKLFKQSLQCASAAPFWSMRRPNGFDALEKWVASCLK